MQFSSTTTIAAAGYLSAEMFHRALVPVLFVIPLAMIAIVVVALVRRRKLEGVARPGVLSVLVYAALVFSVVMLSLTSFTAVLQTGVMLGWPLYFHMMGAGLFVAVLPLVAAFWAAKSCPACGTNEGAQAGGSDSASESKKPDAQGGNAPESPAACMQGPQFSPVANAAFWTMLTAGFVSAGTMLLSMLPLFGTETLHLLLDIHRFAGLVAVLMLAVHLVFVVLRMAGLRFA